MPKWQAFRTRKEKNKFTSSSSTVPIMCLKTCHSTVYDVCTGSKGKIGAMWLPVSVAIKRRRRAQNNKQSAEKKPTELMNHARSMFSYHIEYLCGSLYWHFILFQCGRFFVFHLFVHVLLISFFALFILDTITISTKVLETVRTKWRSI